MCSLCESQAVCDGNLVVELWLKVKLAATIEQKQEEVTIPEVDSLGTAKEGAKTRIHVSLATNLI